MGITTLVCSCGMTLKAVGARPGRVGKCPRCGGLLRVPDASSTATATIPPNPPSTVNGRTPEAAEPKSAFIAHRPSSKQLAEGSTDLGPVKPPRHLERRFHESLTYPLWSWSSIAMLLFLPPILTTIAAPLPMLVGVIFGGSPFSISAYILFIPGILFSFLVFGYVLIYLGSILISSTFGERIPPRSPNLDDDIPRALGRWFWAFAAGGVIGFVPAVAYWIYCGEIDWMDRLMFLNLAAFGMAYAQMALLAALLHDDPLAANPFTVFKAIRKTGWDYAGPCITTGVFLIVAVLGLAVVNAVPTPIIHTLIYWVYWIFVLYAAMVVLRRLGLFCHKHKVVLNWFGDRPTWGR